MCMLNFNNVIVNEYSMIIEYFKSWIKENENKINNLFLHCFECPMKITEMYKNVDQNGTGQSYKNLKKFLSSSFLDEDLTSIEVQLFYSESNGIILFSYEYLENKSYFYSLKKNQVTKFSKDELFKYLDNGLNEALKKDNWSETFGNRYVTMLSKNELGLLDPNEKDLWEKKIKIKFMKDYQKFQSQPVEWNEGITKYLDLLLNAELKKLESDETLSDITYKRFNKLTFKSFICEAPEIEKRLPDTRSLNELDICVYIYALIGIPEDDTLDSFTRSQINEWIQKIKLINVDSIMNFLRSFPFNYINFNFCVVTSEVVDVSNENFEKYLYHKFLINDDLKMKLDKAIQMDKLQKKDFISSYYNENVNEKLSFSSDSENDYFPELPKDYILKCNLLVCALISELSQSKIKYDFKIIKPETYLLNLCENFTQFLSLTKSIKSNFDIINEVPEMHLLSMKDIYYYIYSHLEHKLINSK